MSPAALLAALGGVTLGFGLLSLLLMAFQPLVPGTWVFANLIIGILLLAASAGWGFEGLRERVRSGGGRRTGVYGTSALLQAALGVALLAMLAFLSTRYSERFDWTEQRVNTLSDQTLSLLEGLDGDVELTAFFREQDSLVVRDLLDRYGAASERVTVRHIDPNRRPDLIAAFGVETTDLARGLLVIARGDDSVQVTQFSEAEITNALLRLAQTAMRKVYFLEGHNERRVAAEDDPAPSASERTAAADQPDSPHGLAGFGRAGAALRNETHRVESLSLSTLEDVPEDADALVIAGPTRPFLEGERAALERYLAGGGALLVMIDPRAQTNLYEDLSRWGVEVGDDVLVDPVQSVSGQPTAPVVDRYADEHPIGEKLSRTVFSMARSVSSAADHEGVVPIVFSSEHSWAESDLDNWMQTGRAMQGDGDLGGPVPLAVAGAPRLPGEDEGEDEGKIVVIGDSNFATNELFDVLSNRDLLLNSVNWLLGDVERIAVRPNVARTSTISLTDGQLQAIQYLALFVLPEGIALIGAVVWWSRRREPRPRAEPEPPPRPEREPQRSSAE